MNHDVLWLVQLGTLSLSVILNGIVALLLWQIIKGRKS